MELTSISIKTIKESGELVLTAWLKDKDNNIFCTGITKEEIVRFLNN